MPRAGSSISLQALNDFQGYSALRSTSAAWGATRSSQNVRMVARNSCWTSDNAKVESLIAFILAGAPNVGPPEAERRGVRAPGPSMRPQVAQQEIGKLEGRHLGDPVRDVLED